MFRKIFLLKKKRKLIYISLIYHKGLSCMLIYLANFWGKIKLKKKNNTVYVAFNKYNIYYNC